jgi:UDP-4-amino-4,6-dideoxy-N-acetyl-beta-L-altrosamine transaminase/dTDP-4-dehydrorhamnose reductase
LKKKILIFGASGTLGSNIIYYLKKKYNFIFAVHKQKIFFPNVRYFNFFKEDVIDENILYKKINNIKPDIIINCAANTNLDYCERFPKKTIIINALFPDLLSRICKELSIKLVHISTDHLYNGKDYLKKSENFKTNTINVYAKQKLIAEDKILKNNPSSLIIRTNFFGYSLKKNQLVDLIIKNADENKRTILYDDYFFTTISTKYLSFGIELLIKKNTSGIINIVSHETISKYDFGLKVFDILNLKKSLILKSKLNKKNHIAQRCKNLSLSNKKFKNITNIKIPSLDIQLKDFLKEKNKIEKILFSPIPYGKHSINSSDVQSVKKVLISGSLTQGKFIQQTEKKIATYVGSKYAVLVSSATAGLHIIYKALNLNKKNKLVTSPITFVSTSNAALYCNSKILFNDIEMNTVSLSPGILEKNLKNNNVRIVTPVHMGGLAINMKKIYSLAQKYNSKIVEDAAHALGAKYSCGSKVGSCKYSDATVFSFHPVKIIASGEGGAITTNNKELYEKLISLRSHGITNQALSQNRKYAFTESNRNFWYYEMSDLGYHYRQTEIHAALLNSQLDRIESFLEKRRNLAKKYDLSFSNNDYIEPLQKEYRNISSNHLYILKINFKKLNITRYELMRQLRTRNIITQVHYIPVPIHPFYRDKGYNMNKLNVSKNYYENCLSIPIYYDLSFKQQKYVIDSILEFTKSTIQKY